MSIPNDTGRIAELDSLIADESKVPVRRLVLTPYSRAIMVGLASGKSVKELAHARGTTTGALAQEMYRVQHRNGMSARQLFYQFGLESGQQKTN
jgi:hypothetical protein